MTIPPVNSHLQGESFVFLFVKSLISNKKRITFKGCCNKQLTIFDSVVNAGDGNICQ